MPQKPQALKTIISNILQIQCSFYLAALELKLIEIRAQPHNLSGNVAQTCYHDSFIPQVFLSTYYVPGPVLGREDSAWNRAGKVSTIWAELLDNFK